MKNIFKRLLTIGIAVATVLTSVPDVAYAKEASSKQIEAEDITEEELEEIESEDDSIESDAIEDAEEDSEDEKNGEDAEEKDEESDSTEADSVQDDDKILEKKVVEKEELKEEIEEALENLQDDADDEVEELEIISEDLESEEDVEIFPTNYKDLPDDGDFESYGNVAGEEGLESMLPSKYKSSKLPNLRNQGQYGTCWAHSAMAISEISQGTKPDYSEVHLAYFSYHTPDDPLGGMDGDYNKKSTTGEYDYLEDGGNVRLAGRVLANWIGVADESIAPYSDATRKLNDDIAYRDELHLKNYYEANPRTDRAGVKELVYRYGAASLSYYALQENEKVTFPNGQSVCFKDVYNSSNNCYYFPVRTGTNHAVTIVGWDDNFSRDKFGDKYKPEGDGAWLIRNSWARQADYEDYGGYFWMSYYDQSISEQSVSYEFDNADKYDNNYQYDGSMLAPKGGFYPFNKGANVFTAKADSTGEILKAVAFATRDAAVDYKVSVYRNVVDGNPESGEKVVDVEGTTTYAGYYTVELPKDVELDAGQKFSVVVELSSGKDLDMEGTCVDEDWNSVANISAGQSYVYNGSSWLDYKNSNYTTSNTGNIRIKAFTKNADKISDDKYRITFNGNGSTSGAMSSMSDLDPSTAYNLTSNGYEKAGYHFVGWNTNKDGTGTSYSDGASVRGIAPAGTSITLYAQWAVNTYKVVYNGNAMGVTGSMSSKTLKYGDSYTVASNSFAHPEASVKFLYWNTEPDASGISYEPGDVVSNLTDENDATVTLYAVWYDSNSDFVVKNGVLTEYKGSDSVIVIPNGVKTIGEDAFLFKSFITSVKMPASVTRIEDSAFYGCSNLNSIEWSDNLVYIGQQAFDSCTSLKSIDLPTNLKTLRPYAFNRCSISYIKLPKTVDIRTDEGKYQTPSPLYGISELKTVEMEEGMTEVQPFLLLNLSSVEEIILPATIQSIGQQAFDSCTSLKKITMHKGVTSINTYAFNGVPATLVIYGEAGSYAETFATSKGYGFVDISVPVNYSVKFDGNGADSGSMSMLTGLSSKSGFTLPANGFTRTGYDFNGWNTKQNGSGDKYSDKATISKALTEIEGDTVTLYAQWAPKSIKVTFINDGSIYTTRTLTYGETYKGTYTSLPSLTKTGYNFLGWYTEAEGGNIVTDTTIISNGNDHSLYARWEGRTYTVTFNTNGGYCSKASMTVTYGSPYGELPIPTKSGYDFLGWYTARSGGSEVKSTDTVSLSPVSTLYAHWAEKSYTVSFNAMGGSVASGSESKTVYMNKNYGTLPIPTKAGYDFRGWYTQEDGGDKVESNSTFTKADNETLYARWEVAKYVVTLKPNGGTLSGSDKVAVTYSQAYGQLTSISREGYRFDGWYSEKEGGDKIEESTIVTAVDNHFLYAHWTANEYELSFDVNCDGVVAPASRTIAYDALYGELPTLERTGYTFVGWFTLAEAGSPILATTENKIAANQKLYARWEANLYVVEFDANGGTCSPTSKSYAYGSTYSDMPIPDARKGYGFVGWYTATDGGDLITSETIVSITAGQTLYAHWEAGKYTLSFDANGGELVGEGSLSTEYGKKYGSLPSATKTGYTFKGWFTELADGEEITSETLCDDDATVYAHWEANKYTVTLNGNGGSVNGSEATDIQVEYDQKYDALGNLTSVKTGYTFDGWYTEAVGGYKVTSFTTVTITDAQNLYAHWEAIQYTVYFNVNGGSAITSNTKSVTYDEIYGELPLTERVGYDFDGWYTAKDDGIKINAEDVVSITANTTLYARWVVKRYTVTFDVNDDDDGVKGTIVDAYGILTDNKLSIVHDQKCGTLPTATKAGYIFAGWYDAKEYGNKITEDMTYSSDITVYAHWLSESSIGVINQEDIKDEDLDDGIPEDLWVAGVPASVDYIGTAITFPDMRVYWGKNHLLSNGTDYTVKYANNLKAGTATITITGKGNYAGMIVKTFEIKKLSLGNTAYDIALDNVDEIVNNELLIAPDIALTGNKKLQKGTTTVSYKVNGKYVTLKSGTDYTLIYPKTDKKDTANYDPNAFTADGDYEVIIVGKGNYEGSAKYTQTIRDSKELKLVSKLTVAKIPSQAATGNEVELGEQVVVKDGTVVLTEGTDYKLSYLNNVLPGTASVIIEGTGDKYIGSKVVTFAITGKPISKVVVSELPSSKDYSGEAIDFEDEIKADSIKLTYQANKNADVETLSYNKDFTVSYQNNVNAGKNKATIIFTGIGEYTGTLKKTYTINQKKLALEDVTMEETPYTYQKGGVKPQPVLKFNDNVLVEGKDYTLRYANNTAVNDGSDARKIPTVTITGKGNYTGSVAVPFTIKGSSLDATSMTASDVTYVAKANICKPAITVVDANGVKLVAGTDYDRNFEYTYVISESDPDNPQGISVDQFNSKTKKVESVETRYDMDLVQATDIIPAGTKIRATVTGIGNYAGSTQSETFRIVATNISSATVKIPDQTYTGYDITLEESDLYVTVKVGKETKTLDAATDYEILEGSYVNNIAKGTAKVTIKGKGSYGGTKTVTFKIVAKSMNYEIVYDANDARLHTFYADVDIPPATGTMKTSYTASGAKLPSNTYKRNGFTFTGWNTKADGTGESYGNQGVFKLGSSLNKLKVAIFGNKVTLYAQWTPAVYKITYSGVIVGKNGVTENNNPSAYTIDEGAALTDPVRAGYTFEGWYSDSKFKNKVTSIEKGRYGNIVLYPKWTKNPTP